MARVHGKSAAEEPSAPEVQAVRPIAAALLESQPMPAFLVGPTGPIVPNTGARRFGMPTPHGPRAIAHDGTDLWTIISGRADEAAPFFDVHVRLRDVGGQPVDATLTVVPVRGAGGELATAVVFVIALPGERMHPAQPAAPDELQRVVEWVGSLAGADRAYIVEFDQDLVPEAHTRAYYSAGGKALDNTAFDLRGTPSGSFGGRRVLVVPEGLAQAYPDAERLKEYQAYIGVMLTNAKGEAIGCLSALWREPLRDAAGMTGVLCIGATPAARALSAAISRSELVESEQRYGAVFEGSGVPILLVEPVSTQIVDANPAACAFYGSSRDDLVMMSILQFDARSADLLQPELERGMNGTRDRFIGQQMLSGGNVRDVEISIGPILVGGRKLLYCMVSDITERKRMEAELERSKRSLEHAVGERTQDLLRANSELQQASMTHDVVFGSLSEELRTSLQTITGFSELLLDGMAGELTGEQRRQVKMVREAGAQLSAFARSLVETHRGAVVDGVSHADEFDLVDQVESVLFGLASFAEDKGLALNFQAESRPIPVNSDRYKVQQILLNLLSNAIRYTDAGSVVVTVSPCQDGSVSVVVADTGMGISAEMLETIFDGPDVTPGKAGIGLPASRRIAGAIGGTIAASSEPGKGSTFTLLLPCTEPDTVPRVEEEHGDA